MAGHAVDYRAPDGGWGWMIVLSSFLLQMLCVGITYTFGILYVEFMHYFQETESATAWIGSIQPALMYLTGLICGPLLKRFGWRPVVIVGAVIAGAGMCLSYFASNIYFLYLTYGTFTGVGFGFMYVTSLVAVQHYFDKRRAMATGIAVSGSGVGTLCFGFFTQVLLDEFHWRQALVIEGCVTLVIGVLCGTLLLPLPEKSAKETEPVIHGSNVGYNTFSTESGRANPGIIDRQTRSTSNVICVEPVPQETGVRYPEPGSDSQSEHANTSVVRSSEHICSTALPDVIEDAYLITNRRNHTSCSPCCECQATYRQCDQQFRFSLCKNPRLLMFGVVVILFCFGYHVPYSFTPAKAIQTFGFSAHKASFLVSCMGIFNVLSRLFFGWFGDKSATIRFVLMGSVLILCGLCTALSFAFTTFPTLLLYSGLFGTFSGCYASLYPVVMVDLMGLDVIEYTMGLGMAPSPVAFLIAAPLSGWMIHNSHGYNAAFCMVGSAHVLGGLLFLSISLLPRRYYPLSPKHNSAPSRDHFFYSET